MRRSLRVGNRRAVPAHRQRSPLPGARPGGWSSPREGPARRRTHPTGPWPGFRDAPGGSATGSRRHRGRAGRPEPPSPGCGPPAPVARPEKRLGPRQGRRGTRRGAARDIEGPRTPAAAPPPAAGKAPHPARRDRAPFPASSRSPRRRRGTPPGSPERSRRAHEPRLRGRHLCENDRLIRRKAACRAIVRLREARRQVGLFLPSAVLLLRIKPHHRLAVDESHRRCPESQLHQLLEGRLIRPDILDHERNAVLRKKLFLPVAGPSAGLRIHHHLLRHDVLPSPAVGLLDAAPPHGKPSGTIRDCVGPVNGRVNRLAGC
jgi:hypothetical protein